MSVLDIPRVLFKGHIAWDPITTNNDESVYDENANRPVWPSAQDRVKAFRSRAIDAVTNGGNWNPHGTHRSKFYDTAICGVDVGAGPVDDPFVAAAVNFTGMLVDLEPYGTYSSQLFFDSMTFGIDGGYRILARRSSRITARYINFARNSVNRMIAGVASAVWQTSFAKADGLQVDAFDSPALQALAAALSANDVLGLTVRFNTYRTIYFDDPTLINKTPGAEQAAAALGAKLKTGGFQPNPARSLLVGVVGLWKKDEPAHEPADRALLAKTSGFGSASARLQSAALTIDLSNSVPEVSRDLSKADLGTLSVIAVDSAGTATPLGTLARAQYDRQAYESAAGIVSLPLTPDQMKAAAQKDLQIRAKDGTVLLAEEALRAIPLSPNIYLDEGASATASFQVCERGIPVRKVLPVVLHQLDATGGAIQSTKALQTDASGILSFPAGGTSGGIVSYVATATSGATPPVDGINPQVNTYLYVRTRPGDSVIGNLPATWENVYTYVLSNWNAMAPCMDNWLKLDDPEQVRAHSALLKKITDPANFESFRFMPVTRDMSVGERALLYRFLDAPKVAAAAASALGTAKPVNFAELSRSLRREPP